MTGLLAEETSGIEGLYTALYRDPKEKKMASGTLRIRVNRLKPKTAQE